MTKTTTRIAAFGLTCLAIVAALLAPATAATTPVVVTHGSGATITLDNDHVHPGETIQLTGSGLALQDGTQSSPGNAVLAVKLNGDSYEAGDFPWQAGGPSAVDPDSLPMSGGSDGYAAFEIVDGAFSGTLTIPADWDVDEQPSWFLTFLGGSLSTAVDGKVLKPVRIDTSLTLLAEDEEFAKVTSVAHQQDSNLAGNKEIEVSLRNYQRQDGLGGQKVAFKINGTGDVLACVQTDEDGDADVKVPLPSAATTALAAGDNTLNVLAGSACGEGAQPPSRSAGLTFKVTTAALTSTTHVAGGSATVELKGYLKNGVTGGQSVALKIGQSGTVTCATTDAAGNGTATVPIPPGTLSIGHTLYVLAGTACGAGQEPPTRSYSIPLTVTDTFTAPATVVEGEDIVISGTGWKTQDGSQGSGISVLINLPTGAPPTNGAGVSTTRDVVSEITGQVVADKRLHAQVKADADGDWTATFPFPTPENSSLTEPWNVGDVHRIRVLTGSAITGDTVRSLYADFTVVAAPPALTVTKAASITGTARVGQRLTAVAPTFSTQPGAVTRQWLRNGAVIAGATGTSYSLTAADRGKRVSVRYVATAGAARVESTSASRLVAAGVIKTTRKPAIVGKAKVGTKVRANTGRWNTSGVTVRYRWLRGGKPIAGATKATYRLKKADRGKRIRVRVTVSKPGYATVTVLTKVRKIPRK